MDRDSGGESGHKVRTGETQRQNVGRLELELVNLWNVEFVMGANFFFDGKTSKKWSSRFYKQLFYLICALGCGLMDHSLIQNIPNGGLSPVEGGIPGQLDKQTENLSVIQVFVPY